MRRLAFLLALAVNLVASPEVVRRAAALYQHTEYDTALRILAQDPKPDAENYLLAGKNYFGLADYKKAIECFEKAQAQAPKSSEVALWLGRAWGRRAETGNPLMAIGYASKTRQAFEKAVALDPNNYEAKNDLFDYYLNAPGMVGGGMDKAEAISKSIAAERPAEHEFEEAAIAEKRNDYVSAEAHLRRAMELAPRESGRVVDVAKLLAKRGRFEESDRLFEQARKLSPDSPGILFIEAKVYIEHHRNTERARKLLEEYLKASVTPEDPAKSEAEKLLRSIKGR